MKKLLLISILCFSSIQSMELPTSNIASSKKIVVEESLIDACIKRTQTPFTDDIIKYDDQFYSDRLYGRLPQHAKLSPEDKEIKRYQHIKEEIEDFVKDNSHLLPKNKSCIGFCYDMHYGSFAFEMYDIQKKKWLEYSPKMSKNRNNEVVILHALSVEFGLSKEPTECMFAVFSVDNSDLDQQQQEKSDTFHGDMIQFVKQHKIPILAYITHKTSDLELLLKQPTFFFPDNTDNANKNTEKIEQDKEDKNLSLYDTIKEKYKKHALLYNVVGLSAFIIGIGMYITRSAK